MAGRVLQIFSLAIRVFASLLVPCCIVGGCSSAQNDWPAWGRGASRTMVSSETNAPTQWDVETGSHIKWTAALGSTSRGNPVVCDGVVYAGTNNESKRDPSLVNDGGVLMAFAADDGRFLWQRDSAKLSTGRVNDWPYEGICSSPTVDKQTHRLWYCTNRCEVVCLDVQEANRGHGQPTVVWSVDMIKQLGVFPHNMTNCSPAVWGDFVYVITANGVDDTHKHVVAPNAPAIVCFDKNTGHMVWKDNSPGDNVLHSQWSNPCIAEVSGTAMAIACWATGGFTALRPRRESSCGNSTRT